MVESGVLLVSGHEEVKVEMRLSVLAYNLRRAINILGVSKLVEALRTRTAAAAVAFRCRCRVFVRRRLVPRWRFYTVWRLVGWLAVLRSHQDTLYFFRQFDKNEVAHVVKVIFATFVNNANKIILFRLFVRDDVIDFSRNQ